MPKTHNRDLHEQAFQLYLQGRSCDQIASDLGVAKSTIERWSKGNPEKKEKPWPERSSEIRSKAATVSDKRSAEQLAKLSADLEVLREDIFQQLKHVPFKSKEGAIGSIRSITELLAKFAPRQRLTSEDLTAIWNIFLGDPDIGPVLRKAAVSDRIIKAVDKLLAHA